MDPPDDEPTSGTPAVDEDEAPDVDVDADELLDETGGVLFWGAAF